MVPDFLGMVQSTFYPNLTAGHMEFYVISVLRKKRFYQQAYFEIYL